MKRIKLDTVQKEITLLMVSFFICLVIFFGGKAVPEQVHADTPVNGHEGIIRLHVIANSDSEADQNLKLKVRDEIIKYMEGQDDLEECRKYIISHLDDITRKADKVIEAEGFDYKSTAELGVFYIPRKSYEDLTLPAGNYEALRIVLGEGQGQNWWCVIFPNLCLIDGDSEDAASSDRLIIKSKIKEKIRNISYSHHIY